MRRKPSPWLFVPPRDSAKLKKRLADEFPDKEFIYRVYEALGNYYQIAVGYGLDTVHDFSLTVFVPLISFSLLQAHQCLEDPWAIGLYRVYGGGGQRFSPDVHGYP